MLQNDKNLKLTPRQLQVLASISEGLENAEIAEKLGIASNTVKIHVSAIMRSLGVRNRVEATLVFLKFKQAVNANIM
jgi:DNA-binding NarL/FixJ family response regulator